MKFNLLFIAAMAIAPHANGALMLDKETTAALLKRDGIENVSVEEAQKLADKLKQEYGVQISFEERGNFKVRGLEEIELTGVKNVRGGGIIDYSKRKAADPVAIAMLQLKRLEASLSELSPREKAKVKRRQVEFLFFASSRVSATRHLQHDNEIALVNVARAQVCRELGKNLVDGDPDREFVEGAKLGLKTASCPVGKIARSVKQGISKIFRVESRHNVGYLHSKSEIKNDLRSRILHSSSRAERDFDRNARFPAGGAIRADDGELDLEVVDKDIPNSVPGI